MSVITTIPTLATTTNLSAATTYPSLSAKKTRQSPTLIAQQQICSVVNIKTGQLALRFTPNGKSRAGLNNGNTVKWLRQGSGAWVYVRVLEGPNSAVKGLEGWVNSNYLSCYDDA